MVEAFGNQCGGEVLPTKRRKRAKERPSEEEENASQPAPVVHVDATDENNPVDSMEAGTADALSPNGKLKYCLGNVIVISFPLASYNWNTISLKAPSWTP